jgi:glucokinase
LQALLPDLEKEIIQLSEAESIPVQAIGLAFPGIVDTKESRVISTSGKYMDAPSVDMVTWAKETFDLPFRMENDARLACLGEWRYGAGKGVSDMVMITLGTGIGTAAIMNGKLLQGKHFQAGILGGHFVIDYKNRTDQCSCGRYGCVEAIASMWMIARMAKQHSLYKTSLLAAVDSINWKNILAFSDQGDELSAILKQHCLEVWAIGLINIVHAYDPERIIIGGGISHAEETILPYFRKILKERAWYSGDIPEIQAAKFPDTAALLGAAALFE